MYQFKDKEELAEFVRSELVNTYEASQILNCTRQNLYDLVKRGKLTPVKELHKDKWFWKSDILSRVKPSE